MELVDVLNEVILTLDKLGIPSMLVGSFASTYYGTARYTQDADLVVRLNRFQIDDFVKAFSPAYYLDRGLIDQALAQKSSFNIIHFATTFKVDFFILKGNEYSEEEFSRRKPQRINPHSDLTTCVQTAEDLILSKLVWFRQGGEVSENQWRDVLRIMKTQAGSLDENYLNKWASDLKISELLERAQQEADG